MNIITVNYMGGLGGEFICSQIASQILPGSSTSTTDKNRYLYRQSIPFDEFIIFHIVKMVGMGLTPDEYMKLQSYPIDNRFLPHYTQRLLELWNEVQASTKQEMFSNLTKYIEKKLDGNTNPYILKVSIENKNQLLDQGVTIQTFFPGSKNIYLYTTQIPLYNFNLMYIYKTIGDYNTNYPTPELFIEHLKYKYFKPIDVTTLIPTDISIDVSDFYLGTISPNILSSVGVTVDPQVFRSYADNNIALMREVFDIDFTKQYDDQLIETKCFDYVRRWYAENK